MMTRKKTGPKPRLFSDLLRANAAANDCEVVRASDTTRTAVVRCLACGKTRVTTKTYKLELCRCKHRRPFYREERTTKTHRQELVDRELDSRYKVLSKVRKDVFRYRHLTCGRTFESPIGYLWQNKTVTHFCTHCRKDAIEGNKHSRDQVLEMLRHKAPTLELKSRFVPGVTKEVTVRDSVCGHQFEVKVFKITEKSKHASMLRCPVCHPRSVWFDFVAGGKHFKTRSRVEQRFVEFLVNDLGIDPTDVEYEPKEYVNYLCPVSGKTKRYMPDFRVKSVLVEVKDLNSLGINSEYHWQSKEEALIVNRAKCEAARAVFTDYRVYVLLRGGRFRKVNDFWLPQEQKRLKSI